jgi:CubicO group peptidase (beta-lactamase class C family)
MKKNNFAGRTILLVSMLSLLNIICTIDASGNYSYQPPEDINDGLKVGVLKEVAIQTQLLEKAVNEIHRGTFKEVHSMLIFKDQKLVFEEYFKGHKYKWDGAKHHGDLITWDRTMLHGAKSVTKSIVSACIGIAVDSGFIKSVHQSIFDYLPEYQHLNTDGKDNITIEHLLTMTSGLEWNEWGAPLSSPANDIVGLWFPPCENPITCILERPLVNEPGTHFTYSGGNTIILSEIIKHATHLNIDEFSRKYLFAPLEINSSSWNQFENGVFAASGSLELTPRSLTKIGATFLNNGIWNGTKIISERWIEKSATIYGDNSWFNNPLRPIAPGESYSWGKKGYSYSWWTYQFSSAGKKIIMYYAGGWGGQYIMIFPELNTVVVFTGGNYVTKRPPFKILKKYIIPAIE